MTIYPGYLTLFIIALVHASMAVGLHGVALWTGLPVWDHGALLLAVGAVAMWGAGLVVRRQLKHQQARLKREFSATPATATPQERATYSAREHEAARQKLDLWKVDPTHKDLAEDHEKIRQELADLRAGIYAEAVMKFSGTEVLLVYRRVEGEDTKWKLLPACFTTMGDAKDYIERVWRTGATPADYAITTYIYADRFITGIKMPKERTDD